MGELFSALELLGTVAFAVSGAMVAIDRHADVFGVVFLGMTTAIGGGIVRDGLLGSFPAAIFSNRVTLCTAAGCPLLVFVVAWLTGNGYERRKGMVDMVNNLFDALGLGAFTVTGVRMGLAAGYGGKWFFLVFLGLVTGIGGGRGRAYRARRPWLTAPKKPHLKRQNKKQAPDAAKQGSVRRFCRVGESDRSNACHLAGAKNGGVKIKQFARDDGGIAAGNGVGAAHQVIVAAGVAFFLPHRYQPGADAPQPGLGRLLDEARQRLVQRGYHAVDAPHPQRNAPHKQHQHPGQIRPRGGDRQPVDHSIQQQQGGQQRHPAVQAARKAPPFIKPDALDQRLKFRFIIN